MASIPNLLPALTGALQGFSSARGLDLARKLREQAALDELSLDKFRQEQAIRSEFDVIGEEREEQRAAEGRKREGVEQLVNLLSQLRGGPDADSILSNLDAFSEEDLLGLRAGLGSAVTAQQGKITDLATRESARIDAAEQDRKAGESASLIAQRRASAGRPFAQLQKDDAGNLISVVTFPDGKQVTNVVSREKKPAKADKATGGLTADQRFDNINKTFQDFLDREMDVLESRFEFEDGGIPQSEVQAASERAWTKTQDHLRLLGIDVNSEPEEQDPTAGGAVSEQVIDDIISDVLGE